MATVDQRTPPIGPLELISKALEKNNKNHKVVWLDGADHFGNTLGTITISWLKCLQRNV
jgi:hypothetical protein